jgi:hypothetical protein
MLTLVAFAAKAESIQKRLSMEPANSPFTYEALGATPSLQLGKPRAPDSEAKLAAARERKSGSTIGASHGNEPATLESPLRPQRETKQ